MDKPVVFTFWLFTLISPFTGIVTILLMLVVLNLATNIYSSYVKMETLSLEIFKRVAVKTTAYLLIVLTTHLLETYILTKVPLVKISVGFMVITELKSIANHYQTIYGIHPCKAFLNWFNRLLRKKSAKPSSEEP